ncbi:response regulator uvrY [Escherichia coli HVH 84 (4-1021478)]|nr:response regulator uvrY [Escherichia coli HVH 84 (4-1021478)]
MINVLLVDDHELVRAGIRRILEDIKGIKVVGEASCGEDAVKWCRANAVDVVLMDMSMPGNDSNLLIVFYVQIMPDDFVMQLHRF